MITPENPYRLVDLLDKDYKKSAVGYFPNLSSAIGAYYTYQQMKDGFCILSIEQKLPCVGWYDITHELKLKEVIR